MKHLGKTPPFRGSNGEILPGSIAEIRLSPPGRARSVGDDPRRERRQSAVDPSAWRAGLSGDAPFPHFNAPLEKSFTVVYWEQRGTDKSFDRKIPISSMTVEQFIADLDELVDAVRKRLGKDKVAIYGHSWGSALGVLYAARFPDKVAAYVGTGQIGDWPASELSSYAFTLAEAERRNNRKALKELRAIGPPPHTFRNMWCSANGSCASSASRAECRYGSFAESLSAGRNRRSSIYPTSCVASCFPRTHVG